MDSPIKWVGGKRILRKDIIPLIPKCDCYIEVFGGAGWVLFGKNPKDHKAEVYNDINSDVVNFFKVVRDKYDELEKYYEYMLVSREIFDKMKYYDVEKLTDIQKAFRFWYMLKYAYGGRKNHLSDYNYGYGTTRKPPIPEKQKALIDDCYKRIQNVYIENLDYKILLKKYDSKGSVFYCDPPYLVKGKCYGDNDFTENQHVELCSYLSKLEGKFVLTINDSDFFRDLYKDFYINNTEVNYSSGNANKASGKRKELIITNYKVENMKTA